MSLAANQPTAIDTELEKKVTTALKQLLTNQGSLRLTFRLARHEHAESLTTLVSTIQAAVRDEHPYKVEQTLYRLLKDVPESLRDFLEPRKPRR